VNGFFDKGVSMKRVKQGTTILVIDPVPARVSQERGEMMASVAVPVEAIRSSLQALLGECQTIFAEASKTLGVAKLAHVDLSLSVAVDGSVGLLGAKVGSEAKGGIVVRLVFDANAKGSSAITQ
jgi:hypothetical protein